ncbi:MAG: hypothetical protein CME63_05770 [Halobacteriovoraceae bacterium]|jgi:flagellar FliL protein|nr:hypothetical protein [Halobacteriovoraceae bacterium]MBC97236.1 hypothetical protein [Halobacteriovoraceae bacterium]|tara:strand:- start:39934 stop:40404 length:471 start_codon:yes stop_codon:yes gene_type:complete
MTGNKSLDNILLLIASLITAATLGIFVYSEMLYQKPLPSDEIEKQNLIEDSKVSVAPDIYKVEKLIINLNSASRRLRFLELEAHLVPFKSNSLDIFEAKKFYVKDAIIDIASNMAPEELNTVAGKVILEERIRKRLNDFFGKSLVKEIYFSIFVVQ